MGMMDYIDANSNIFFEYFLPAQGIFEEVVPAHRNEKGPCHRQIAPHKRHPGEEYNDKNEAIESIGYGNPPIGDYGNVVTDYNNNGAITRHSYVYFPVNNKLYYVDLFSPSYIKKVSSSKGLKTGWLR